jgi:uncharacterized protein
MNSSTTKIQNKKFKLVILLIVIFCFALFGALFYYIYSNTQNSFDLAKFSKLEIADTSKKRDIGLMNRKELCQTCGMIFVFKSPQVVSFWMKDTFVPLDIIFINPDTQVSSISYNTKTNQTSEIYSSTENVKYVIEVNAGYASKNNIKIGTKINIETAYANQGTIE